MRMLEVLTQYSFRRYECPPRQPASSTAPMMPPTMPPMIALISDLADVSLDPVLLPLVSVFWSLIGSLAGGLLAGGGVLGPASDKNPRPLKSNPATIAMKIPVDFINATKHVNLTLDTGNNNHA